MRNHHSPVTMTIDIPLIPERPHPEKPWDEKPEIDEPYIPEDPGDIPPDPHEDMEGPS